MDVHTPPDAYFLLTIKYCRVQCFTDTDVLLLRHISSFHRKFLVKRDLTANVKILI